MRPIKFRAWDLEKERMVYGDLLELPKWITRNGDDWVVMQSTGLFDKNNEEIYEGDLYTRNDGKGNFLVRYNHGKFGLVRYGHNGATPRPLGSKYNLDNGEVIGNIYENPDLLK